MKQAILNREFQHPTDGWYQIEVPGEHLNEKSGLMQVIDSVAVNSIVNRFNKEADNYQRTHGVSFPGMLIDHENFKHQSDKETRAYGWLMRMENRGDIPFGKIQWTATGKPAIDGGDYRFFSTEYDRADLVVLDQSQKSPRVRPMRLDGLTLTNDPNNKGSAPITNRAGGVGNIKRPTDLDFLPTPALDKWLQAVNHLQHKAEAHGSIAIDFNTAWEWAKKQFPDLYKAAFGTAEQSSAEDEIDTEVASAQVANLANRIAAAAHRDMRFGLNFISENLPVIFNRTKRCGAILNREPELQNPDAIKQKAARLFNRLVQVEQASSKMPHSFAWRNVVRDNPTLHGVADGSLTFEVACAREPELRNRLL